MNVYRGSGIKVHSAIVTPDGFLYGTRCACDTRYGNQIGRNLTETTEPVDCKICLGDVPPAVRVAPITTTSCLVHILAKVYAVKTVKDGTYTVFSCGCKVWH